MHSFLPRGGMWIRYWLTLHLQGNEWSDYPSRSNYGFHVPGETTMDAIFIATSVRWNCLSKRIGGKWECSERRCTERMVVQVLWWCRSDYCVINGECGSSRWRVAGAGSTIFWDLSWCVSMLCWLRVRIVLKPFDTWICCEIIPYLVQVNLFTNDAAFPNFLCFLDDRHDGFVALGILRLLPKWMSFLVTDKVNR